MQGWGDRGGHNRDSANLDYALRDTLVSHVAQTEQSSTRTFEASATDVVGKVCGEYIQHTRQLERCKRFPSCSDRLTLVDYDQKAQNSCSSSFKDLLAVGRGCAVVRWV